MTTKPITILGIFVADVAFRSERLPTMGETLIGAGFKLGPGGKGSNQAVAARRAGGAVNFITKLGRDPFGTMARETYQAEGISESLILESDSEPTGAAAILIDDVTGNNAIIVVPGAAGAITEADVAGAEYAIAASSVFMTQLEVPVPIAAAGLRLAKEYGVPTILNPAPAAPLPDDVYRVSDIVTPNESEAEGLTGRPVVTLQEAEAAADFFLSKGVSTAVITLGENGCFVKSASVSHHVPAFDMGDAVVETTGAGDAFNGGFAVALADGADVIEATRFGNATAAISVTRAGTAPSMPTRDEIEALLAANTAG